MLAHNSLLSVAQLCDAGCEVTFTKTTVVATKTGKTVMTGPRDSASNLWRVDLTNQNAQPPSECNHAHEARNQKDLINYLHATAFSPVKSTWIKAIKNGNFVTWPGLTAEAVVKHLSQSTATSKGHMNQQRMNSRSTQPKSKVIKQQDDEETEPEITNG